jgi:Lon protease-like protein
MSDFHRIPLFPLHSVLFPSGLLPLRIFEARYLDMVSDCLANDRGFGVCLIREGAETGQASIHEIGTLARIVDWDRLEDGLLGITGLGERRFRVIGAEVRRDRLLMGTVQYLADEAPIAVPGDLEPVASLLGEVLERIGERRGAGPARLDEAGWVADRMAELLPVELELKQRLLETGDAVERLGAVGAMLTRLESR